MDEGMRSEGIGCSLCLSRTGPDPSSTFSLVIFNHPNLSGLTLIPSLRCNFQCSQFGWIDSHYFPPLLAKQLDGW
jgi:hypothetical protein